MDALRKFRAGKTGKPFQIPPHLSKYRIRHNEIKINEGGVRGRGATGAIMQGALNSGTRVAIKKLQVGKNVDSNLFFHSFIHEVGVLANLCHPNITELLGFVEDVKRGIACIIIPWEANGNVRDFLRSGEWDLPERISLIQDVCLGLQYLHQHKPPICHGDLKSLNILVNDFNRALITDFGSTRIQRQPTEGEGRSTDTPSSHSMIAPPVDYAASLTVNFPSAALQMNLTAPGYSTRWAAPELLSGDEADLPCDIWAFGWVCWEIITGALPFSGTSETRVVVKVLGMELPALQADAQLSKVLSLCNLIKSCLASDPKERPDASQCHSDLRWMPSSLPSRAKTDSPKKRSTSLLCQLGHVYRLQDAFEEAQSSFKTALASAEDDVARARSLVGLGEVCRAQGQADTATSYFDQAQRLYSSIGHELGQANVLVGLGHVHLIRSDYLAAVTSFTQAREIFARLRDDFGQLQLSNREGSTSQTGDAMRRVAESYIKACASYAHIGDDLGEANALAGLGEAYFLQGQYTKAEASHIQALEAYTRIGDNLGKANALRGLGNVYYAQCQYTDAEGSLVEAEGIYLRIGNDQGQAHALSGLGSVSIAQSKFSESERRFTQARDIYARIHDRLGETNALIGLGYIHSARCKFAEAEASFNQARDTYTNIGDENGTAHALSGLGDVYNGQGKYKEAEESFKQAESLYERSGDRLSLANVLRGSGDTAYAQHQYLDAERLYLRAERISTLVGDQHGRANALTGLGGANCVQSRFGEARQCYEEAITVFTTLGDELGKANALKGLGDIAMAEQRYDDAEGLYEDAQDHFSRVGNETGIADVTLRRGHVRRERRQYIDAAKYYEEAEGIYARSLHGEGEISARHWLDVVSRLRAESTEI